MELQVIGKQKIGNYEFVGIEGGFGENEKALRVKDIADIHKSTVKRINELITRNKKRFKDGLDIIDLKSAVVQNDIENFGFNLNQWNPSKNIYILSERGYSKLLKILEDDTAWEIYDELVDGYFKMRESQQKLPTDPMEILKLTFEAQEQTNERVDVIEDKVAELSDSMRVSGQQEFEIKQTASSAVIKILGGKDSKAYEKLSRKVFSNFWSEFKKYFKVPRYGELPKKRFDEALKYISFWAPDTELRILIATENAQTELFNDIAQEG